jgi:hypothetical protein
MARSKASPKPKPGPRSGENARSGPSQPEDRRTNKLVALRLSPELRAAVEARAAAWGLGVGPALARLVEAGLEVMSR